MDSSQEIWINIADKISKCIDKLGTGEFYPRFFQMMKIFAKIDQYMVFEFSPNTDYATCRLAYNIKKPALGIELASLYLEGAYLDDPMLKELKESVLSEICTEPFFILKKRELPPIYRKRFFNIPNFETKFSIVVLDKKTQHIFYLNFYSEKEYSCDKNQFKLLQQTSSLIGSLLLKHFQDERNQRGVIESLLASGLSEREAQVCNMILQGHTAKSIGSSLGLASSTIITYKNRAFSKLHINSKLELVRFI